MARFILLITTAWVCYRMIACIICFTPKKEIGLLLMQWQNCHQEFLQFQIVNCTAVILSPALLIHYSICRIIACGLYGSTRIISLLELMAKAILSTGTAR